MRQFIIPLLVFLFYATGSQAGGIADLQAFIADTHTAQADVQ